LSDLPFSSDIPDPLAETAAERVPVAAPVPRPASASPTRGETERRRIAAFTLSVAWLVMHLFVFGIRTDFHRLPSLYVVAEVLLPALFGAGSLLVALAPGRLGLGLGIGLLTSIAIVGPLSFIVLAAGAPVPHPPVPPASFWGSSFVCLSLTLAWAAAPLVLAAIALRRAFTTSPAWRSALVGAGIGLWSGATINLHCPNVDPAHLLTGHALPVAVSALIGAFIVARWTRA
jgi:hypothetical protein